jgi:hypothetical protein
MLKRILLTKVAFWLVVIGAAVLLLPHAAWPRWVGWVLLIAGAVLAPVALLAGPRSRSGPSATPPTQDRR